LALLVRADGGTTTCGGVATYTRGDRALSAETKKIENSRIDFLRAQEDHDGRSSHTSVRYGTRLGDLKNKQPTHTRGPVQVHRGKGGEEEDLFVFNDTIEGPRAPFRCRHCHG